MARRGEALSLLTYLPQGSLIGIAPRAPLPRPARLRRRLRPGAGRARARTCAGRVEGNLRLIFPDMPAAERRRIRGAMADSFGRTMIEVMTRRAFQARGAWSGPAGPGWTRCTRRRPRAAARSSSPATSASGRRCAPR